MISKTPKVLVACPVHESKAYCIDEWLNSVQNFQYKNFDIFLADNSPTDRFSKYLKSFGVKAVWNNPKGKDVYRAMEASHEGCRKHAIENNYDYLFHLECDVFPTSQYIIQDLLQHNKAVVAGLYHIQKGPKSILLHQRIVIQDKFGFETETSNPDNDMLIVDGQLKQVFSAGLGCAMIHKSAFHIPFRTDGYSKLHPDTFYCIDLHKARIPVYVDTSIICRHKNSGWDHLKEKA